MRPPAARRWGVDQANSTQAFYLSFEAAVSTAVAGILAQARAWADWLQKTMQEDALFLTRPMDHLLQGNPGASKYLGIVLDAQGDTATLAALADKLDQAKIPYSVLSSGGGISDFAAAGICDVEPTFEARCLAVEADQTPPPASLAETILSQNNQNSYWNGPRADGRYHAYLPPTSGEDFAEMMARDPLTDQLLLITGARLTAPIQQEALVLENIPTVMIDDRPLPPALFRASAPHISRQAFNACDTGRFLLALSALKQAGLTAPDRAENLIAHWDISGVLRAEEPYDFNNGRWENAANSHCTQYSRNGYMAWGFSVKSAYPRLGDANSGDQSIGLLYGAANIGHFGTEPLLLEGLEVGYSRETAYLSEVLFDARSRGVRRLATINACLKRR